MEPAATAAWLGQLAESTGARDPRHLLGDALRAAFPLPPDDPALVANALAPGGPPLEVSLTTRRPGVLRFVFEPGGPAATPDQRRQQARQLLVAHGRQPLPLVGAGGRYGAVLGAVFDAGGIVGLRLYEELSPGSCLAPPLAELAERARESVDGLVPLFWSQDHGGATPSQRVYLLARAGLSFFQLDTLARAVGAPGVGGLVSALRPYADRPFGVSPGWAVIGLRAAESGTELKVDLLRDPTAENRELRAMLDTELQRRLGPVWTRWSQALCPEGWTGGIGAVGVSGPHGETRTVYWRPRAR